MHRYLIVMTVGLLAQFIDGTLGMGYGASSASFLIAAGLLPAAVSASVHLAEIFSSLASGISHFRLGNVDRQIILPLTLSGVVGGIVGAYCLSSVDGKLFRPYVALLLLALGVKIIYTFAVKKPAKKARGSFSKAFLVPLGLIGGAVDAIGGGGWGPICTPALISTNRSEPRFVVGSVDTAEFLTTVAITVTFAIRLGLDSFLLGITLPLLVGGVIAAPLAAYACKRINSANLGVAIGIVLIVLNMKVVAQALSAKFGFAMPVRFDTAAVFGTIVVALVAMLVRSVLSKRRAEATD